MLFLVLVFVVIGAALVVDVFATLPSKPLMSSDALDRQGSAPGFVTVSRVLAHTRE